MFSKKSPFPRFFLFSTVFLVVLTRFVNLDWGYGFFFHPDENNMASAISRLSFSDFNPHFFAYGQFPLYLVFFTQKALRQSGFNSAIYILRFYSALFSSLSVLIFYQISQILFRQKKSAKIFTLLLIFSPGLIQLAHFGTTESFLIFIFAVNLYLSFKLIKNPRPSSLIFLSALSSGLGLASKIIALIFTAPIYLAIFFRFFLSREYKKFFIYSFLFSAFSFFFFLLFSPYNLISFSDFLSTMRHETSVAIGTTPIFYTRQFISTPAYLFQFQKIFPYTSGLPVFVLSFIGLFLLLRCIKNFSSKNYPLLILVIPSLVYFLYTGRLYTKWTRFASPLFYLFPLLASYVLGKISHSKFFYPLLLTCLVPGLLFLSIYFRPDVRLTASSWIDQNIPPHRHILSEAGNILNLPLATKNPYQVENFDFFTLDSQPRAVDDLVHQLYQSEYILIPSRRIFKNQTGNDFPISQRYYEALFSGNLGFTLIKQFSLSNSLILDSESAEETWSVFDNPVIRIYKKTTPLDPSDYQQILSL